MKLKLVTLAALGVGVVLASACSSDEEGEGAQTSGTGGKGGSAGSLSGGRGGTTSATGGSGGTGGGSAGCTSLALPCDGPEDCPTGNMCCGHFVVSVDNYVEFQCLPSCANAATDGGMQELWLELCHAGQACEDSTYTCSSSTYLPPSLSRCYDTGADAGTSGSTAAGEINCGTSVCTSEQQCCLVTPGDSFCAAKGTGCGCTPSTPDAGDDSATDAGTDASATGGAGGVSGAAGVAGAAGRRGGGPGNQKDASRD